MRKTMISSRNSWSLALGTTLAVMVFSPGASAQSVMDFYKGKKIAFYVGYSPGGGYDAYSRLLSRHMGRNIPGTPGMVVKNMPGAASMRLANYLYNKARRDGSEMGIFASSIALAPLFGSKMAKFDPLKFTWIGNLDQSVGTCSVWHTSGLKTFDDLLTQPAIFGASSPLGSDSEHARGYNYLFGTRIKVIHGYAGSTGVLLATKRGEVQGGCGFQLSTLKSRRRQDWKSGKLVVLVQNGFKKSPDLKGVPHIYDYVKTDEDKKVLDLIYGRHILGRPISAPPQLPKDRVKALRAAFMATVKDKAFLKEAKRLHLTIQPWDGKQVEKILVQFLSYPKSVIAKARKAMEMGKVIKVKLKRVKATVTKIGKKRISVTDKSGKKYTFKLHRRRTKISIAGSKVKRKALKVGMTCDFRYYANKDLTRKITCP